MNSNKTMLSVVLTAFGLATALIQAATAAPNDAHKGSATVRLQYVYGVQQSGSPDPAHDAACKKQLSQTQSKYLGMTVKTTYSIDPQSLIMSANSSFRSPVATQPLQLNADLKPLGLADSYSFGVFRPTVLPSAYGVMFSVDLKFAEPKSTFIVFGPKDQTYNCVISSAKLPFKAAESAKFSADAK
ncbi:MAG: hypothetical protein V4857_08020 [Pseudomonadota bacterium]